MDRSHTVAANCERSGRVHLWLSPCLGFSIAADGIRHGAARRRLPLGLCPMCPCPRVRAPEIGIWWFNSRPLHARDVGQEQLYLCGWAALTRAAEQHHRRLLLSAQRE